MTYQTTSEQREALDHVYLSLLANAEAGKLIWFSRSGSNGDIAPVTAAFLDAREALAYACAHPDQMVHFPDGTQLGSSFAVKDNGVERFLRYEQR